MKRFVLFLLAALMAAPALADVKLFRLEMPTEYENGDPLTPADDIASTAMFCATGEGDTKTLVAEQDGPRLEIEVDFPVGTYYCAAAVVATNGLQSGLSNEVSFTIEDAPPSPPGAPTITIVVEVTVG